MRLGLLDERDHPPEGRELTFDVTGPTHGGTDVQPTDHLAGRTRGAAERREHGHQRGRDSGLFQAACDQTHGLMADRSRGYEERRLDRVGLEARDQLGDRLTQTATHASHGGASELIGAGMNDGLCSSSPGGPSALGYKG